MTWELCWGTVERADAFELVDAAADAGFGSVAIAPRMLLDLDPGRVRARLADQGVRARVVDAILSWLPGSPDPITVDEPLRTVLAIPAARCFDLAEELGSEVVNVAHFLGTDVEVPAMATSVAELAGLARERGLRLTLEFIPGTGLPDLARTVAVIGAAASDNVSIMLDTWHFARSGGTVDQLRALAPGAIGGLQVSDRVEPPAGTPYRPMEDRRLPGQGELPLRELLAVVLAANPGVPVGLEVFSERLRALPPNEAARLGRASLTRLAEGLVDEIRN
jgi:sugar phosphate isomerase/epimerase